MSLGFLTRNLPIRLRRTCLGKTAWFSRPLCTRTGGLACHRQVVLPRAEGLVCRLLLRVQRLPLALKLLDVILSRRTDAILSM